MLSEIANKERLLQHAFALKSKKFKAGFDGMTAQAAIMWLEINGEQLCKRLLRGSYEPMPASAFRVAKHGGGYRSLTKLTALDTIIQNAILDAVTPFARNSSRSIALPIVEVVVSLLRCSSFAATPQSIP